MEINQAPPTRPARSVASLAIRLCVATALLQPLAASAATMQGVSTSVRNEVAARPANAASVLEKHLRSLSPDERQRFAAGALAAALEGAGQDPKGQDCDRVLELFKRALATAPRAVLGLMEVAHRACPDSIAQITEAAIRQVQAAGLAELVPAIVARAVALAPDQRAELVRLALTLAPPNLGERILDAVTGLVEGRGGSRGVGIGGTINPANIGGSNQSGDNANNSPDKGNVNSPEN